MRKILIALFFITLVAKISQLSAYCIYNKSNEEVITVYIGSNKKISDAPLVHMKTKYVLRPKGKPGCWNWKDLAKKIANRTKQWYWVAFKGVEKTPGIGTNRIGEGYFPVGGAIVFSGYDENARAKFDTYYESKPWKYYRQPWNWPRKKRPWKTYKR